MEIKLRGKTGSPGIGTTIVTSRSETVITELAIMAAQTALEVSTRDSSISLHAFEHKAGAKTGIWQVIE